MHRLEQITARGTGVWGGRRYDVELVTTTTTWSDSRDEHHRTLTSYALRCSQPVGRRCFGPDPEARDAFMKESFSELDVRELDPPEIREPVGPLDGILGERLSSVEFVADYVQLRFDGPPLNLYVWPRVHADGGVRQRPDDGYADALVGLIGRRLVATDELLDLGLVLDFDDGSRLAVPLDGTEARGSEVAEFGGEPGGLWATGEPPFGPGAGRGGHSLRDILARRPREAVHGFMRRWHGLTPGAHPIPDDVALPAVLAEFHRSYGTAVDAWLINHLWAPEDMEEDEEDRSFVVFYSEEQGVYLWAIAKDDLEDEDPPVWCRENDPGEPWVQEAPSLSVFLVQMLVMSAALSGPHAAVAAWLPPADAARALAGLDRLDLPPWHWPGHPARWYAGDEVVAFTCPNVGGKPKDEPDLSVWVSALSQDAIRFLEPHLTDAWDYYSPRDG